MELWKGEVEGSKSTQGNGQMSFAEWWRNQLWWAHTDSSPIWCPIPQSQEPLVSVLKLCDVGLELWSRTWSRCLVSDDVGHLLWYYCSMPEIQFDILCNPTLDFLFGLGFLFLSLCYSMRNLCFSTV
jgi:hypothetical protein